MRLQSNSRSNSLLDPSEMHYEESGFLNNSDFPPANSVFDYEEDLQHVTNKNIDGSTRSVPDIIYNTFEPSISMWPTLLASTTHMSVSDGSFYSNSMEGIGRGESGGGESSGHTVQDGGGGGSVDFSVSWFSVILMGIIVFFTIVGNILVCLSVILVRKLRKPQNYLLVSLATSDLFVALFVMPFAILVEFNRDWPLNSGLCDLWVSADVLCCTASILNLCGISVDRYQAITAPFDYSARSTPRRMLGAIFVVWLGSACVSLPPVLLLGNEHMDTTGVPTCRVSQNFWYQIYATMASFYIPLCVMVVVYLKILRVVTDKKKDMNWKKKTCTMPAHFHSVSLTNNNSNNPPNLSACRPSLTTETGTGTGTGTATAFNPLQLPFPSQPPHSTDMASPPSMDPTCQFQLPPILTSRVHTESLIEPPTVTVTTKTKGQTDTKPPAGGPTTSSLATTSTTTTINTIAVGSGSSSSLSPAVKFTPRGSIVSVMEVTEGRQYSEENASDRGENGTSEGDLDAPSADYISNEDEESNEIEDENEDGSGEEPRRKPSKKVQQSGGKNKGRRRTYQRKKSLILPCMSMSSNSPAALRKKKRLSRGLKEHKASTTLGIIMSAFIICWLPFFVLALVRPIFHIEIPEWISSLFNWLGYANSALNPVIYATLNRDFRRPFREILSFRCATLDTLMRKEFYLEQYGEDTDNIRNKASVTLIFLENGNISEPLL